MAKAVLLLGSNIEPEINLRSAIQQLKDEVEILRYSHVWETESVGSPGPNFLNMAIEIETIHNPDELSINITKKIENNLGRIRTIDKNAPRTIDIDIIIFEGRVLDNNLWTKSYTSVPVADLHPDIRNQNGIQLSDFVKDLKKSHLIVKRDDLKFTFCQDE